jgi:DNA-binding transcriptional LysR family regulator
VDDDALVLERVLRIELVAALPEGHPLTAGKEVPMRPLAGERLILFSRRFHPNSYDYIVGCCKEAGFSPNVVQRNEPQLYTGATTCRMVASGAGIGIVVPPLALGSRPASSSGPCANPPRRWTWSPPGVATTRPRTCELFSRSSESSLRSKSGRAIRACSRTATPPSKPEAEDLGGPRRKPELPQRSFHICHAIDKWPATEDYA